MKNYPTKLKKYIKYPTFIHYTDGAKNKDYETGLLASLKTFQLSIV